MKTQHFYRIASAKYRTDLSGKGAELVGGRFNEIGTPAVYTASSISLATLELLVHASNLYPMSHSIMAVDIPVAAMSITRQFEASEMPKGWDSLHDLSVAKLFGKKELFDANLLGILVPSVIVPEQHNLILNPRHTAIADVKITELRPLILDERLLKK